MRVHAALLLLPGCVLQLQPPANSEAIQIACAADADCPWGLKCNTTTSRCSSGNERTDVSAPQVCAATLTPAIARRLVAPSPLNPIAEEVLASQIAGRTSRVLISFTTSELVLPPALEDGLMHFAARSANANGQAPARAVIATDYVEARFHYRR
ncbi:MAG: hypothetical protein IT381_29350 [Deltaproteobacteria bacterium]|nr:hypothetical protein [Deltaproteobacteria bacterium]